MGWRWWRGEVGGTLAIIVFRAGGRVQLAGGKAGSGGGVGVAGATTKRGGTPTQKTKKTKRSWAFFAARCDVLHP